MDVAQANVTLGDDDVGQQHRGEQPPATLPFSAVMTGLGIRSGCINSASPSNAWTSAASGTSDDGTMARSDRGPNRQTRRTRVARAAPEVLARAEPLVAGAGHDHDPHVGD